MFRPVASKVLESFIFTIIPSVHNTTTECITIFGHRYHTLSVSKSPIRLENLELNLQFRTVDVEKVWEPLGLCNRQPHCVINKHVLLRCLSLNAFISFTRLKRFYLYKVSCFQANFRRAQNDFRRTRYLSARKPAPFSLSLTAVGLRERINSSRLR